jgi:hypothetical protein
MVGGTAGVAGRKSSSGVTEANSTGSRTGGDEPHNGAGKEEGIHR